MVNLGGKSALIKFVQQVSRTLDIRTICFHRCLRESNSIDSSWRILQHCWDAISNKLHQPHTDSSYGSSNRASWSGNTFKMNLFINSRGSVQSFNLFRWRTWNVNQFLLPQQKPEQPCKSYTPLGALSSMQPPGTQGNRSNMSPRRHSAFSAPHQHGELNIYLCSTFYMYY